MFILRKITGRDGIEINFSLGESYTLVTKGMNKPEFDKVFEVHFKGVYEYEDVYGFITSEGGKEIHPLFGTQKTYIMTESGQTFSRL